MGRFTFDVEEDGPVDFGFGVDLALVEAGVARPGVGDAQPPVAVDHRRRDAAVAGVADAGRRQNGQVPLPHPRHLRRFRLIIPPRTMCVCRSTNKVRCQSFRFFLVHNFRDRKRIRP